MGKRLRIQRRGKGSGVWRGTRRADSEARYVSWNEAQRGGALKGEVLDLVTDAGHSGVIARILFEDASRGEAVAPEGMFVGQQVQYGRSAALEIGNVLPLTAVTEGCPVFNVEKRPGDGGRFLRASGAYGLVLAKDRDAVFLRMRSGKTVKLGGDCRATIGCAAGGGRPEKPMVKAGAKYHLMRAKHRRWPITRGVAMNAVSHPFGGSQHHAGKSKSTSRHAPPGRKVGAIASKRTGRKKK